MLELKNISKTYKSKKGNNTLALNNISLSLPEKGMIFLTGKSGSGKSTLLNIIGGLDKVDSGDVIFNGKNFKKFRDKDFDSYRNTYIGFVFQDFNILDEYNVYDNIKIALNLQKKKTDNKIIDEVLLKFDLQDLGKRNINELSGGQKQRVAIARSIIKSPDIILADEPTGNLDSNTSEQIFKILKEIAKEKLVIIVSHDIESANTYADRIIELQDGKIIKDIGILEDTNPKAYYVVKSKLKIFDALKFAFKNLKRKKIRLFFTIILITFSLILFGMSTILSEFNIPYTHASTMIKENNTLVEIHKKIIGKNYTTASPALSFTDNEIDDLVNKIDADITKVSRANYDNWYLEIEFGYRELNEKNNINSVYYLFSDNLYFIDNITLDDKIIGNYPKNNEVLISKILADYIIRKGVIIKEDKEGKIIKKEYYPDSYEDIIKDRKHISFGNTFFIISGIIDEDLSKYDNLKNITYEDTLIEENKLYQKFKSKYIKDIWKLYVSEDFFKTVNLKPNTNLDYNLFILNYLNNDKKVYTNSVISKISDEIEIYNGINKIKINKLNDNEIVINTIYLDEMTNNEYSSELFKYLEEKNNEYTKQELEREKLLESELKKQEEDENYEIKDIHEIKRKDNNELKDEFTIYYVNKKNIINQKISLEINDINLRLSNNKTNKYEDLTIIGIEIKEVTTYLSDNIISKYIRPNNEVSYIYFNQNNLKKLETIFKTFSLKDSKYISKTIYTDSIIKVEEFVNNIKLTSYYISYALILFATILFMNFIMVSINNNKKQIGILRAIGARKKDIFKIYILESFIIGIFSLILSVIGCIILSKVGNYFISQRLFFNIEPIIFRDTTTFYLLFLIIILTLMSSIIPLQKITNMKPIDAILNK